MLLSTAEDLAAFVSELQRESDRGLALVAAALIDEKLSDTLSSFFCESYKSKRLLSEGNSPLGTFSSRIELSFALGLIDKNEYEEISIIRKVRNKFAHSKHGMKFENASIVGLCNNLTTELPKGEGFPTNSPRFRFINASVSLVLRLYYRPDFVRRERRTPREWLPKDATRWRSFAEEKPPINEPMLVLGKTSSRGP